MQLFTTFKRLTVGIDIDYETVGANGSMLMVDEGNLTITMPKTEPKEKVTKAIEVS